MRTPGLFRLLFAGAAAILSCVAASALDPVLAHASVCATSLQAQVDAAPPGSTVTVAPCIYRETMTITKPLTLIAQPGTEIRGSDVWSDWRRSGAFWTKGPMPVISTQNGICAVGSDCHNPYQVMLDGRPLVQVADAPTSGQFMIDAKRDVVLADDPGQHEVEVTTRQAWIIVKSDNVTLDGFTMQHAANDAQTGALISDGVSNLTVRNAILANAHGVNVQFLNGSGQQLVNSEIHHAGQLGVSAFQTRDVIIQGNRIHDNNTAGFDPDWEAGGLKFSSSFDATWEANEVYGNAGQGLWCDLACQNITIRKNRVHANSYAGIVFEISDGATIVGNAVWNNASATREGWACEIFISSSSDVEVAQNTTLATTSHGILVVSQNRTDAPNSRTVANVTVHDNNIIMSQMLGSGGRTALGWLQDWGGTLFNAESNNRGYNNKFWLSDGEASWERFAWGPQTGGQGTLAEFAVTPGGEGSQYLSAVQRDQALNEANVPSNL